MKKIALTLTAIAFALTLVFSPATHAAGKPTPQSPLIECQNTTWIAEATASNTFSDGITEHAKLMALRDSTSNSYCGELKVENIIWEPVGDCFAFDANLYKHGAMYINGVRSTPPCGSQGALIQSSPAVESSGTFYGLVDDFTGGLTGDFVTTPEWTIV